MKPRSMTCSVCGEKGHNKRGCKNIPLSSDEQEKRKSNKSTKGSRHWLFTQWLEPLERGGSAECAEKTPELLDPQSQTWLEERLEELTLRSDFRYMIYQIESANGTDSHFQGYIEFKKPITLVDLVSLVHRTTDITWRMGKREDARHYCKKGSCGKENCSHTWKAHGVKECQEFSIEVVQPFQEFGVWVQDSKRADIELLKVQLHTHDTWKDVLLDDTISLEVARFPKFAKEYFAQRPRPEFLIDLLPWQMKLMEIILSPPNDRTIHWVLDEEGGKGKSTFARYLVCNYEAIVLSGSRNDILYAYDNEPIVLFDLSRTQEGKGDQRDRVSYAAIEDIKNGIYFTPKFHSRMHTRKNPIHLFVFSNWLPDFNALSPDRWNIIRLDGELNFNQCLDKGLFK